jgi:hypothetical protein
MNSLSFGLIIEFDMVVAQDPNCRKFDNGSNVKSLPPA